ncbi:MAG: helix-turn-helix transcriptional regulator [Clostridiales bacterium]|nr:helix-turn-helix transcriptional regulator [Clostridiales bacterium]
MIVYDKLWETMKKRGITKYSLVKNHQMNERTIRRLNKNMPATTTTIDRLCKILECRVEDICEYVEDDAEIE